MAAMLAGCLILSLFAWHHRVEVDDAKVHPAILARQSPFRTVRTAIYDDGGSMSVALEDALGESLFVMLPHPLFQHSVHGKLFLGHYLDGIEVDEEKYPDTRSALLIIIEDHSTRQPADLGVCWRLSTHPLDRIRFMMKRILGHYNM